MAIYIGLKLEDQVGANRIYSFFSSDGTLYGSIAVDTSTKEIVLIEARDKRAEKFSFPRARRAIQKALDSGDLPNELCYAA